jgi:hypothetical protein
MDSLEVARALGNHKSWDTKGRDCPENRCKARGPTGCLKGVKRLPKQDGFRPRAAETRSLVFV